MSSKSHLLFIALIVLMGTAANALSTVGDAPVNPKPITTDQLVSFTCESTDCQHCTRELPNPNATFDGNCGTLNDWSNSLWIYPNGTLLQKTFANSDCSGSPSSTQMLQTNKCMVYGVNSAVIYYQLFKKLKTYTCSDVYCQNCTLLPLNRKAWYNGNCETLNDRSVSEWILPNNTLQTKDYANTGCSGSPVSVSNIALDKCIATHNTSMIVKYEDEPGTRLPALVKDIKPFTCNGTECNGCTLEKLGPNVTVRGNCAMWKNKGYSVSYYLVNNGATLEMHYFDDNTLCVGQATDTFKRALNKCILQKGYSEIIYYTGGSSTTFDDVPFVTTEEFSFTKERK